MMKRIRTDINQSRLRGVGLMEAVVYVALLAMLFVILVNSMILMTNAFAETRLRRAALTQAEVALTRMASEVRRGRAIDAEASTFETHPGTLVFETIRSAEDDTIVEKTFALDSGTLTLTEEGGAAQAITDGVTVSDLVFRQIAMATTSEAVRIELTVERASGARSATQSLKTTAVLRGSY